MKEKQTIQSMSRKGNCLDNSPTECLFSVVKREFWFREKNRFKSFKEFKTALEKYISYYNNDRIVNKLKGLCSARISPNIIKKSNIWGSYQTPN